MLFQHLGSILYEHMYTYTYIYYVHIQLKFFCYEKLKPNLLRASKAANTTASNILKCL